MKERNRITLTKAAAADKNRNWKAGQATTGHLISLPGKCINIWEAREKANDATGKECKFGHRFNIRTLQLLSE
jgi:hypothetical protein